MRRLAVAVLAFSIGACHKDQLQGSKLPPPSGAHLPPNARGVFGYNRQGTEAELAPLFADAKKISPAPLPDCFGAVLAKVDRAEAVVTDGGPLFIAHGAGLRAAFEACLKPTITEKDGATGYAFGSGALWVRWHDADTILIGDLDEKSTAALDSIPVLPAGSPTAELLGHADQQATLWGSIRVDKEEKDEDGDEPDVQPLWIAAAVHQADVKVTLKGASAADAAQLAKTAQLAVSGDDTPMFLRAIAKDAKFQVAGDEVHVTAPLDAFYAAAQPGKKPSPAEASAIVLGTLSAVVVPSLMKNAKKAQTTEAVTNVKKIYDGARTYFDDGAKKFPGPSMPPTPPLGACCKSPDHKCQPDPKLWTSTWQALKFSMDDPHHYSYAYEVDKDGTTFAAQAFGDLDCDGTYSTFEMVGSIGSDGKVTGQAGMFKDNELE
jgi:hypothetical protein